MDRTLRRLEAELRRRRPAGELGQSILPGDGYPDDLHHEDGLLVAARTYGEAWRFLRYWYPRRFMLVSRLANEKGLSQRRIGRLIGVNQSTIGRWIREHRRLAEKYEELLRNPPEETGW